jgi:GR25 family glycosyltransferase involved in LPS biosynthesis
MPWEYFDGINVNTVPKNDFWGEVKRLFDINFSRQPTMSGGAAAATVGHFAIWKKIVEEDICAVVLEHDALMLHKPEFNVPDMRIVCLGYKVTDPENYKHLDAGPPTKLEDRKKHGGAHAYALTPETAKHLLNVIRTKPKVSYIDNQYFLSAGQRGNATLMISDPICAIGWLRESTIWSKSAVDNYAPILESFKNNYDSNKDLGVKTK